MYVCVSRCVFVCMIIILFKEHWAEFITTFSFLLILIKTKKKLYVF